MTTRRLPLVNIRSSQAENAGLWLDKFITEQDRTKTEARRQLVEEVADIAVPQIYREFIKTWKRALYAYQQQGCIVQRSEAEVSGSMIIGTGNESVLEAAISLHHTYGVPYIPGSALKGLAANFARHFCGDDWREDQENYKITFGLTDESGCVIFFDALYIPTSDPAAKPLRADVLTVHHEKYYQGSARHPVAPTDYDDPNPVPFLSARGKYLIALAAPSDGGQAWLDEVFAILRLALSEIKVGGKTSSGYGRIEPEL